MRIPRRIECILLAALFLSTVECATTKPCDESLIIGFKPAEMLHVGDKQITKCNGTGKALRMSTGENVKEITCFDKGKWLYDGKQSGVNSSDSITVLGCFETTCDEHKITKGPGVTLGKGPPLTLSCAADQFATIKNAPYKNLTCDDKNWKDERGEAVMAATASFAVECQARACHPGLVQLSAGAKRTGESIGCEKPDHELRINASYHSLLKCDKTSGWKDGAGKKFASADDKFSVECVEKTCDLTSFAGVSDLKVEAGPPAKMKCDQPTKGMLIGDKIYDELTCVKGEKWKEGSKELDSHKFTVSCIVKACHHSFIAPIGQGVDTSLPGKLSCKNDKNEIRVNGSDSYGAEFTCDKDKGWVSDGSKVVARADARIAVECVEKTCHKSLLNSSNVDQFKFEANETNKFVLSCNEQDKFLYVENAFHKSLECMKHEWTSLGKNASEQFAVECAEKACHDGLVKIEEGVRRESSALACSNANEQLHITNSSFYADKLACNATSGWSDGSTKLKGAEDEFSVECVTKDGNASMITGPACTYNVTALTMLEDIKVSKTSENSSEISLNCEPAKVHTARFIQHKDTKFASLHCTEERGWVDQNDKPIGMPADQLLIVQCAEFISCMELFPIDTKCDPAWEGCQELQILEPKPSQCPKDTRIFIRKSGSTTFKSTSSSYQGRLRDEVHCNGVTGWAVTYKQGTTGVHLGKGDTIICAENNPLSHHEENNNSTDIESNSTDTKGIPQSKAEDGSSISEESAMKKAETWMATHTTLLIIIASAFAGSIILSIAMIVVYKVFVSKQTPTSESDPSREKLVDDRKNRKRMREGHGCNDAILDDQIVEAPAELKL